MTFQIQLLCRDYFSANIEQGSVKDMMNTKGGSAPPPHDLPDISTINSKNDLHHILTFSHL